MKRPVPDEVVIGLLKSHPSHGYELIENFRSKDQLGHMWRLSTSQLYAVLKRLEQEGEIHGKRVKPFDAPERVVYSVTDKGYEQLETWLFDPNPSASIHRIRVLFLSRLFIAQLLGFDLSKIFKNQREACKKQRVAFQHERQMSTSPFERITLDFIINQLESATAWLNRCEYEFSGKSPIDGN